MEMQGPEAWYAGLPRITRGYITLLLLVTLLAFVNAFDPLLLSLNWILVREKLEAWRIVSNCLYIGPFSFRWMIFIAIFTQFSSALEKDPIFSNSIGSYLYFILIEFVSLSFISAAFFWPTGYPYLGDSLLSAIIYYWSRRNLYTHVSIYFFTVKGYQLPFAILFFHMIMGSSIWIDIIGILSGHLYYIAREVMPRKGFPNLFINTPFAIDKLAIIIENALTFTQTRDYGSSDFYRYRPTSYTNNRNTGFIGRGIRLGEL